MRYKRATADGLLDIIKKSNYAHSINDIEKIL